MPTTRTRCVGFEQITVLTSAVGLASIPSNAAYAVIQAESQTVRWRSDGTNPTTAVGNQIFANSGALVYDSDFSQIKFIEEAASAKLNVHYFA